MMVIKYGNNPLSGVRGEEFKEKLTMDNRKTAADAEDGLIDQVS